MDLWASTGQSVTFKLHLPGRFLWVFVPHNEECVVTTMSPQEMARRAALGRAAQNTGMWQSRDAVTWRPRAKRTSQILSESLIPTGNPVLWSVLGPLCCLLFKNVQMSTQVHTKVNFQTTYPNIPEAVYSTPSSTGIYAGSTCATNQSGRKPSPASLSDQPQLTDRAQSGKWFWELLVTDK